MSSTLPSFIHESPVPLPQASLLTLPCISDNTAEADRQACLLYLPFLLLPIPKPRDLGVSHLALELENAIHQCLTTGRTSGDINIHGDNSVASPDHTVTIMVITPAIRTAAHANDPSRFRHLIVHLAQGGSHLVSQGARNDHDIRLSRGSAEDYAQTVLIVSGSREMHHFDGTAGEAERHGPEGALTAPVGDYVEGREDILGHAGCFFFAWERNFSPRALHERSGCGGGSVVSLRGCGDCAGGV